MTDRAVGLVYVPELDGVVRAGLVDMIEIEPETFWWERDAELRPYREVWQRVRELPARAIVHGVGHAVGGAVPPPARYAAWFAERVHELGAAWASHHLAFNWWGEHFAGFFLPPLQNDGGVRAAIASTRALASRLDVPFAIETGVNYLRPRDGELADGELVARVAEGADCHILLDLHNLWCNERNGRQSIDAYLEMVPLDRVIEVHVASGFAVDGYWLDAHSGPPPAELLAILAEVAPRLPAARAVVLEVLSPFANADAVAGSLDELRTIWERPSRVAFGPPRLRAPDAACTLDPVAWEHALGRLVGGATPSTALEHELAADPAVGVLATLVTQARAGMIADGLPMTLRLLLIALGEAGTTELVEQYTREVAPSPFAAAEGDHFAAWLAGHAHAIAYLADAIAFDRASARAQASGQPVEIDMTIEPHVLVTALRAVHLPQRAPGRFRVTVTP